MTHDSQPPRMLSAPLRLTAMTLRGLGPYLHGARLEIKPLTILCGENGSGKSTWIEMLRSLKTLSKDQLIPCCDLKGPHTSRTHPRPGRRLREAKADAARRSGALALAELGL